jgi:crotonobetaine/carnitine-CoA ligase
MATWYDPRVPDAEQCVLRPVLERFAAAHPDKTFARFADGSRWTWGETLQIVRRAAAGLQALGVKQHDRLLSWLPNGPDALRVWFGANWLGAVYVPVNTAYRGAILAHALKLADAALMVAHAGLVDRLQGLDTARVADVVVRGGDPPAAPPPGVRWHGASTLDGDVAALRDPPEPIEPWHNQSIVFTSGTTGPSKGVESSYLHLYSGSFEPFPYLGPDDRYLVALPLFHVGGTVAVYSMLLRGASIAVIDAFQADAFWHVVKATGSTFTVLLGSMVPVLARAAPSPADRDHTMRRALMIPLSEDPVAFSERFGCEIRTVFNMTEISVPLVSQANPTSLGSCGRPREGMELRVVDAHDCEVAPGTVGELVVRSDRPWAITHGYFADAAATARAWRNGWFHTGDAFRIDERGDYFFVDRMKDSIRRRGENISSFEVEAEVASFDGVQECAAVAVPSPLGEDEVLVAVVPKPGCTVDPEALVRHLLPRMAHFMVPRYVRVVDALPKTPTQKVQKHALRSEGVTPDAWDRDAAGLQVRRTKL